MKIDKRVVAELGLVLGNMAALLDEYGNGKQEQEDKREVEFGAAELADHDSTYSATSSPSPPEHLITEFRIVAVLMSIPGRQAFDRVLV